MPKIFIDAFFILDAYRHLDNSLPSPPIYFPRKLEIGLILIQVLSHPKHTSTTQ